MMKLKYLFVLAVSCMTVICTSSSQAKTTLSNSIQSEINKLSASAALEADSLVSGKTAQVAAVCFITDTENCGGYKFDGGTTPGEECLRAGYVDGVCPEGSHAESTCPGDSSYHTPCVCNSDMTATCTYPYQGVGAQCNGKYKECCNTCPDYP
ncbi:hypothetical protein, partial [uncultured Muribaculum sp.]|uniref:hypothetical protein n=1 Tax=uncultured Muribaculum sp. TaxID=1918613 RepID=UPI0025AF984F